MKHRRKLALVAIGAVSLVGVAAGCGDDEETMGGGATTAAEETMGGGAETAAEATVDTATTADAEAPEATVSFQSPKMGASVAQPVMAKVKIEGFKINADMVGKPPSEGMGHLHFEMDGGKFDQPRFSGANGKLAVMLGVQGKYSPSVTPSIAYKNLPKGEHTLVVYLANNDHSNAGPKAETSFTVK
jgi:hypothetical protein